MNKKNYAKVGDYIFSARSNSMLDIPEKWLQNSENQLLKIIFLKKFSAFNRIYNVK